MDQLPLALQREICSFAAGPELIPRDVLPPTDFHSAPDFASQLTEPSTIDLQRLSCVCRAWREITQRFCAEYAAKRVLTLNFTTGREHEQELHWKKTLLANGHRLLDLRIIIASEKRALWWDLDAQGQEPSAEQAQDAMTELSQWVEWRNLLKLCPNLRRLDLSGVPLHHLAMGELLDAASTYCKQVKALILPKKDPIYADAVADNIDFVSWRLYDALERWSGASNGGLLQLTVPSRSEFDREGASNEFLAAVQKFCPKLEYLDGWKRSYTEKVRLVESDESFCVSRDVWKAFCGSCVAVREFSWVVVPFSDEFFLPFGQTTKPQLTRLQLTYNTRSPYRIRRNEYSTGGLNVLIGGCPSLEHLDVVLHRLQPCDSLIYPQLDEMIDAGVFNDDFLEALVENCPRLRSIRIRELRSLVNSRKVTCYSNLKTITDRGLAALWRAPRLTCIDLQEVRCSSDAILSFLQTDLSISRCVQFQELGVSFGNVVQNVLGNLSTTTDSGFRHSMASRSLAISLSSRRGYVFERSWLVEMQRAFRANFTKSELRFAVFSLKKNKDTGLLATGTRSAEQEVVAKILARAWIKGDVLRIGRLVVYTQAAALDKHTQDILETNRHSSWIVME